MLGRGSAWATAGRLEPQASTVANMAASKHHVRREAADTTTDVLPANRTTHPAAVPRPCRSSTAETPQRRYGPQACPPGSDPRCLYSDGAGFCATRAKSRFDEGQVGQWHVGTRTCLTLRLQVEARSRLPRWGRCRSRQVLSSLSLCIRWRVVQARYRWPRCR